MTQSSDMVSIRVSRETRESLKKLKKGNMTYDDVISSAVSDENWDVDKIDADCDKAIKNTKKFHSIDEIC